MYDDVNKEHVLHFDTRDYETDQPVRLTSREAHVWFGHTPEECFAYPGPDREHTKFLFMGPVKPTMEDECIPSFELYGRIPVPGPGCAIRTTTARASARSHVKV